jgi:hypothetical protein
MLALIQRSMTFTGLRFVSLTTNRRCPSAIFPCGPRTNEPVDNLVASDVSIGDVEHPVEETGSLSGRELAKVEEVGPEVLLVGHVMADRQRPSLSPVDVEGSEVLFPDDPSRLKLIKRAARLVWAHRSGYATAKARRTTWESDRPLIPSEAAALVEAATKVARDIR